MKKFFALLVTIAMVVVMLPASLFRTEAAITPSYTYISPIYKNANSPEQGLSGWETKTLLDYDLVTDSTTDLHWTSGWYVVSGAVEISGTIYVEGHVKILLLDNSSIDIVATDNHAGIEITDNASVSLTIYSQHDDYRRGVMDVCGSNSAAIGGAKANPDSAPITINGGLISAIGGAESAAIGSGFNGAASDIVINGGVIKAIGSTGAGIGSGYEGSTKNIVINGGIVNAQGDNVANGIGIHGANNNCGAVYINGGTVCAYGGIGADASNPAELWMPAMGGITIAQGGSVKIADGLSVQAGHNDGTKGTFFGNFYSCLEGTEGEYVKTIMNTTFNDVIWIGAPCFEVTACSDETLVGKKFNSLQTAAGVITNSGAFPTGSVKMIADSYMYCEIPQAISLTVDMNDHLLTSYDFGTRAISLDGKLTIVDNAAEKTSRYFTDALCAHRKPIGAICNECGDVAVADGAYETYLGNDKDTPKAILVKGGAIYGCYSSANGGAAIRNGSTLDGVLTCKNISFVGNYSTDDGGAVYFKDNATFIGCSFLGNVSEDNGGALSLEAQCLLKDCIVSQNKANNGGGIYFVATKASLMNTSVTGNYAKTLGGGIYLKDSNCLAEGTLITMADGSTKKIEDIKIGDMVRTFSHQNGALSAEPVVIAYEGENAKESFALNFEGDVSVRVVDKHDFWDLSSCSYVAITESNATNYVGHKFYNAASNSFVTLESVTKDAKVVKYYSIYTAHDMNCIANGMLSVPDDVDYILNCFEMKADLSYDLEKQAADIAKYGIFDYVETGDFSEEYYDVMMVKYLNVVMGKGLLSYEQAYSYGLSVEEDIRNPQNANLDYAPSGIKANLPVLNQAPSAIADPDYSTYAASSDKILTVVSGVVVKGNYVGEADSNLVLDGSNIIHFYDAESAGSNEIHIQELHQSDDAITDNGLACNKAGFIPDNDLWRVILVDKDSPSKTLDTGADHFELFKYNVNSVNDTIKGALLDDDNLSAELAGRVLDDNDNFSFSEGEVVGYALSGTAYKCLKRESGAWTALNETKTLAELKTANGYVIGLVSVKQNPVVTAPTALTLTENGEAQTLITAGSTSAGTLEYKLGKFGTYSTTLPQATEAGSYDVYYHVVGNDDYLGTNDIKVVVTVATFPYANYHVNQVGSTTKSAALDSDTLTAAAADLILNNSTITFAEGDVVGYALSGTAYKCLKRVSGVWTSVSGTKTLAELKSAKGYVIGVVTLKTAPVVTAPKALTLTENGTAQTLISAGSTTGGTLEYKLDTTGTYSTTLPQATEAGSYDVYYRVVGNDDYLDAEEAKVTVTISDAVIPPVNPDPVPATGDFSLISWAAMAMAAAIGGVLAGKKKKK